jgi:uncharacterized membrane protein YfcA
LGIFAAGLLRGFTGFGLALAAVPLLALVLPPQQVVPVIVTLQLLAAFVDLPAAWHDADWRALRWLTLAMMVCTPAGFVALAWLSAAHARLVIGLLILASVALLWRRRVLPVHPRPWMVLAVGAVCGLMNGVAAMPGPPVVVYFLALDRPARVTRASAAVFFVLTAATAIVPLTWKGLATRETMIWSLTALPALLGGQWIGGIGFRRSPAALHRLVALIALSMLSVLLIVRALASIGG